WTRVHGVRDEHGVPALPCLRVGSLAARRPAAAARPLSTRDALLPDVRERPGRSPGAFRRGVARARAADVHGRSRPGRRRHREAHDRRPRVRTGMDAGPRRGTARAGALDLALGDAPLRVVLPELLGVVRRRDRAVGAPRPPRARELRPAVARDGPGGLLAAMARLLRRLAPRLRLRPARREATPPRAERPRRLRRER